jgi:hypothetical protein
MFDHVITVTAPHEDTKNTLIKALFSAEKLGSK